MSERRLNVPGEPSSLDRRRFLAASGTAHDHYASPAMSDRRWVINERVPRVPAQLGLNRCDQCAGIHAGECSIFAFCSP